MINYLSSFVASCACPYRNAVYGETMNAAFRTSSFFRKFSGVLRTNHRLNSTPIRAMATTSSNAKISDFEIPAPPKRMHTFGGPSVWLEFSPLSSLTNAVNLGQGFPDWSPPPFVAEAAAAAVRDKKYAPYARSSGIPELVSPIAEYYSNRVTPETLRPRAIDPMSEVIVTVGASQAISLACQALLDDGDEVVLIEPAFDIYSGAVAMAGAKSVYVPLREIKKGPVCSSKDLILNLDELESVLSDKTKMLILNSPHNPTGKVFTKEEYQNIARLLDEKCPGCLVLSDEVYEHILYDGEHIPFASVSRSAFQRTLSVYSAGKTFSTTGWKIGWIVCANATIMRRLQIAQQYVVFSVSTPTQAAIGQALRTALSSYEGFSTYYDWLREEYRRKRDLLVSSLEEAGLTPVVPEGAFYVLTHVPDDTPLLKADARTFPSQIGNFVREGKLEIDTATMEFPDYNICRNFVLQKGVTAIPPSAFYSAAHRSEVNLAKSYARFAFCKEDHVLIEARKRLLG